MTDDPNRISNAERRRIRRHGSLVALAGEDLGEETRFAAARAAIPSDTRDLTARLCGDPLPGRSALDRRAGRMRGGPAR